MKRHWFFDVIALVIGGCIILYIYLSGINLKTQLLTPPAPGTSTTVDDCSLLSEQAANDCYAAVALREKNASICNQISKSSQKQSCQREIELAP